MSDMEAAGNPSYEHDHEQAEAAFVNARKHLRKVADTGVLFTVLRSGRVAKHCFGRTHAERVNMICLCIQDLLFDLSEATMDALDEKENGDNR